MKKYFSSLLHLLIKFAAANFIAEGANHAAVQQGAAKEEKEYHGRGRRLDAP